MKSRSYSEGVRPSSEEEGGAVFKIAGPRFLKVAPGQGAVAPGRTFTAFGSDCATGTFGASAG